MSDDPFVDADWAMAERLMNNVDVCCCDKCHADIAALLALHRNQSIEAKVEQIEHLRELLPTSNCLARKNTHQTALHRTRQP